MVKSILLKCFGAGLWVGLFTFSTSLVFAANTPEIFSNQLTEGNSLDPIVMPRPHLRLPRYDEFVSLSPDLQRRYIQAFQKVLIEMDAHPFGFCCGRGA